MTPGSSPGPDAAPHDAAAVDARLRRELGRRMTLAMVAPVYPPGADVAEVAARLAAYSEVRLLLEAARDPADSRDIAALLATLGRHDPDVMLICAGAAEGAGEWAAKVLSVADGIGLRDRSVVALFGAGITTRRARALGYEDGFPLDTPLADLMRLLVRETLARDEARRRGSSPPCYL
jgi:hypothetical protein